MYSYIPWPQPLRRRGWRLHYGLHYCITGPAKPKLISSPTAVSAIRSPSHNIKTRQNSGFENESYTFEKIRASPNLFGASFEGTNTRRENCCCLLAWPGQAAPPAAGLACVQGAFCTNIMLNMRQIRPHHKLQ